MSKVHQVSVELLSNPHHPIQPLSLTAHKRSRRSDSESEQILNNNIELSKIVASKKNISEKKSIITDLLNKGADIDFKDSNRNNNTPLHLAVKKSELEIVNFLLIKGAQTTIKNNDGKTPIELAENLKYLPKKPELKIIYEQIISTLQQSPSEQVQLPENSIDTAPSDPDQTATNSKQERVMPHTLDSPAQQATSSKRQSTDNDADSTAKKMKVDTQSSGISHGKRPHENNNEDDVSPEKNPKYYASTVGLKNTLHGVIYQLKLLMLFVRIGVNNNYQFRIATEMNEAGKFDDLVFECENLKENKKYRLLQAKHKQSESKITANDLLSEKDGDFSLQKYFISFREVENKTPFQDSVQDFILCTNINFDTATLTQAKIITEEIEEEDIFFPKVENQVKFPYKRYKIIIEEQSPLYEKLRETSDIYMLAKTLVRYIKKNQKLTLKDTILKYYHAALVKEGVIFIDEKEKNIGKFSDKFIENPKGLSDSAKELWEILQEHLNKERLKVTKLQLSGTFGKKFELHLNPQITNIESFTKEFVELVTNAKDNVVNIKENIYSNNAIESRVRVIVDNISKLAGHVLIIKDKNIQFRENFFDDSNKLPGNLEEFKAKLKTALQKEGTDLNNIKQYQFKIFKEFKTCGEEQLYSKYFLPNDKIEDEEIKKFFEKLVFAVNQPDEDELSDIINNEMGEDSKFNLLNTALVTDSFEIKMLDWFKKKGPKKYEEGTWLTRENADTLFSSIEQEINSLVTVGLSSAYPAELKRYDIEFKSTYKELENFLNNKDSTGIFMVPTLDSETLLSTIKVYQTLTSGNVLDEYKKEDSYIFMRLKTVLIPEIQKKVIKSFDSKNSHHLLIINCNSVETEQHIQGLYSELSNIINYSNKKVILITEKNHALAKKFAPDSKSEIEYDKDRNGKIFNDLTQESQVKILEQKVNFQGHDVKLDKLINFEFRSEIGDDVLPTILGNGLPKINDQPIRSSDLQTAYVVDQGNKEVKSQYLVDTLQDDNTLLVVSGLSADTLEEAQESLINQLNLNGDEKQEQRLKELTVLAKTLDEKTSGRIIFLSCYEGKDCLDKFDALYRDLYAKPHHYPPEYAKKVIQWVAVEKNQLIWKKSVDFDFYCPRQLNIYQKVVLKQEIQQHIKSDNAEDRFIFERLSRKRLPGVDEPGNPNIITVTSAEMTEDKFKEEAEKKSKPIHWVKEEELQNGQKQLIWHRSRGSLKRLSEFLDRKNSQSDLLKDEQFSKIEQQVLVITDEPGMGKSTTLTRLSQEALKDFWVIRLNFRELQSSLEKLNTDAWDYDSVSNFLADGAAYRSDNPLQRFLLRHNLEHKKQKPLLLLLLDGFDEIKGEDNKDKAIKLLEFLKDNTPSSLRITTRKTDKQVLENFLYPFSSTFEALNSEERKYFLRKRWQVLFSLTWEKKKCDKIFSNGEASKFEVYVKKLLDKVDTVLREKKSLFMGIPLQMQMLAVVFQEDFDEFVTSEVDSLEENHFKSLSINELYQRFVNIKYDIYITEKSKANLLNLSFKESLKLDCTKAHQKIALQWITSKEKSLSLLKNKENKYTNEDLSEIGIIQFIGGETDFIHKTFAEYYVADFFINQLSKSTLRPSVKEFLLNNILLDSSYQNIRIFINDWLTKNLPNDNILTEFGEEIKLWLGDFQQNEKKTITPLHVACKEGNTAIVGFLMKSSEKKPETLEHLVLAKKNDMYLYPNQINSLYYAIYSNRVDTVKKLLGFLEGDILINLFRLTLDALDIIYSEDMMIYMLSFIKSKKYSLINCRAFTHPFANLNPFADYKNTIINTMLLYIRFENQGSLNNMVSIGSIKAVKELLDFSKEMGVLQDFIEKTSTQGTVLHTAVKKTDPLILIYLLNFLKDNLGKDTINNLVLTKKLDDQRTALHDAIYIGGTESAKELLRFAKEEKKEMLIKMVGALDNKSRTALHLAAISKKPEAVEEFLVCVKDSLSDSILRKILNIQDGYGFNALHWAAKKGKLSAVQALLDTGYVTIDIKNQKAETALKLAAQEKHWEIAVILVEHGADANNLNADERNLLKEHVINSEYYTEKDATIELIDKKSPTSSIDNLKDLSDQGKNLELQPTGPSGGPCGSQQRRKRDLRGCAEEESEHFFPYDPLEETVPLSQAGAARLYSPLALAVAWQDAQQSSHAGVDNIVRYNTHIGDLIHEGIRNHSPREQNLLQAHYQRAQQLFSDHPKETLLKQQDGINVPVHPQTTHHSWLLDNGQHSLSVLHNGQYYQLYSQDFNYHQRFKTKLGTTVAEIQAFAQAFFKWRSGSSDYTTWTLQNPLPEKVQAQLSTAVFSPDKHAPDSVLLSREQSALIEGIPATALRELVYWRGVVPDYQALYPDFLQQHPRDIQFRVDKLHTILPTLTKPQRRALVTVVKKYDWLADTTVLESVTAEARDLLADYQQQVMHELKTADSLSPERLSALSWQTLSQEFDRHPDISPALKQQVLESTQETHATVSRSAWAKGMATQTLFFLPDIIRSANSGHIEGLATNVGMLAGDATLNHLYMGLVNKLTPMLSESRAGLLRKLPVTSPIFKVLTVYSIVELTKQLQTLPADSEARSNIKHQLGEQYVTAGLMVAELLGFEVTPLWIALIAEQLIFSAISFRKENHLDIPFWEAFVMSLGFKQDKLQHIFEERQLVVANLATVEQLNTHAQPPYGWILVKVPLLDPVEWQTIDEQQIPPEIKQQILHQPEPFSWSVSATTVREASGFRHTQIYEIELVGLATAIRGPLVERYWQRGNYPAHAASVTVKFAPGGSRYQEDNIFLAKPEGALAAYQRVASVAGENYKSFQANTPVQISGVGLAALYANSKTFSDGEAQRNLYVGFDPCEGNMHLWFTAAGLQVLDKFNQAYNPHYLSNASIHYQVTVQVGHKAYTEAIIFPQTGGLLSLRDSSRRVNSQYFVRTDRTLFRIRDDAVATRIAFTTAASDTVGYAISSDGPEIIRVYTNNVAITDSRSLFFSTLWLKGHKQYLQLMLHRQIIDGTLQLAAEQVDVLYAKGKTANHSEIILAPSVSTFSVTVVGDLRVMHDGTTLKFVGEGPEGTVPVRYSKTTSGRYGAFYELKIEALRPVLNTLSLTGSTIRDFSTPGLKYNWHSGDAAPPLKITGQLAGQSASLTLEQNMTTLIQLAPNQYPSSIEVEHHTQQTPLDNQLVLQYITTPTLLNVSLPGEHLGVHDTYVQWSSLVFQARQGYPVVHHFTNNHPITLNDIDYQVQGNTLYAIGAKNNLITGDKLLRYRGSESVVGVRFPTLLKESALSLENGSLVINQLRLENLPDNTTLYFDQEAFPLKALKDSLPLYPQVPAAGRSRRDLPGTAITSGANRLTAWPNGVFKSISKLLVGMLNPWWSPPADRLSFLGSSTTTAGRSISTCADHPLPDATPTDQLHQPSLLELGDHWFSQANHQGLLQLLDLLVRKWSGKKHPHQCQQAISNCSMAEACVQAAVIVEEFCQTVNKTALACGISASLYKSIDNFALQQQVAKKIYAKQSVTPTLFEPVLQQLHQSISSKATQKQADKFLGRLRNRHRCPDSVNIAQLRQQLVSISHESTEMTTGVVNKIDRLPVPLVSAMPVNRLS